MYKEKRDETGQEELLHVRADARCGHAVGWLT